jgi:hypothetical protein
MARALRIHGAGAVSWMGRPSLSQPEAPLPRYRAFISYSHRDSNVARWLHRAIEAQVISRDLVGRVTEYGPIPRWIRPIFRDEDELAGAAELGPKLRSALEGSAALIVICSPASAKSTWVDREIRLFKAVHPDRPVLAVIVEGAPGSETECFPEALRWTLGPDGALVYDATVEPLAPDLQKQDRHSVKLKIIAGLLGVGFDDLVRRDLRRTRRLMAAYGSLGAVVITALTVLSIAALTYGRIAIEQRNIAEHETKVAEHNAVEAERRAWLAEVAAQEVRRESDLIMAAKKKGAVAHQ